MSEFVSSARQFVRDNLAELCREILASMDGDGVGPLILKLVEIEGSHRFVGELIRHEAVRRVAESTMERT